MKKLILVTLLTLIASNAAFADVGQNSSADCKNIVAGVNAANAQNKVAPNAGSGASSDAQPAKTAK